MSKNKKQEEALRRQRDHEKIQSYKKYIPLIPHFRQHGCDLPFYDYLDTFEGEFKFVADQALKQFPSLLEVMEVEESQIDDKQWFKNRYPDYEIVNFKIADDLASYETSPAMGVTVALARDGKLFQSVAIRRNPVSLYTHPELNYGIKLTTLHHELGHVHDMANGINGLYQTPHFPIVAAEVYANVYALERLAERCCVSSYDYQLRLMELLTSKVGFEREIGLAVIAQHPRRQLPNWQDFIRAVT